MKIKNIQIISTIFLVLVIFFGIFIYTPLSTSYPKTTALIGFSAIVYTFLLCLYSVCQGIRKKDFYVDIVISIALFQILLLAIVYLYSALANNIRTDPIYESILATALVNLFITYYRLPALREIDRKNKTEKMSIENVNSINLVIPFFGSLAYLLLEWSRNDLHFIDMYITAALFLASYIGFDAVLFFLMEQELEEQSEICGIQNLSLPALWKMSKTKTIAFHQSAINELYNQTIDEFKFRNTANVNKVAPIAHKLLHLWQPNVLGVKPAYVVDNLKITEIEISSRAITAKIEGYGNSVLEYNDDGSEVCLSINGVDIAKANCKTTPQDDIINLLNELNSDGYNTVLISDKPYWKHDNSLCLDKSYYEIYEREQIELISKLSYKAPTVLVSNSICLDSAINIKIGEYTDIEIGKSKNDVALLQIDTIITIFRNALKFKTNIFITLFLTIVYNLFITLAIILGWVTIFWGTVAMIIFSAIIQNQKFVCDFEEISIE